MDGFIGGLWWYIVAIGVLVTFHEFGHYWVAKRCGVKVLRFSVGFGKPLWMRKNKDGTEFADRRDPVGRLREDARRTRIRRRARRSRIARSIASRRGAASPSPRPGRVANILLCVLFLWGAFVVGLKPNTRRSSAAPTASPPQAGLRKGDEVLRIGDRSDPDVDRRAFRARARRALDRERVAVAVRNADGDTLTRTLDLSKLPAEFDELQAPTLVGLTARYQLEPPIVDDIVPGSPAYGVLAEKRPHPRDRRPAGRRLRRHRPGRKALAARGGPGMIEVLRKEGDAHRAERRRSR